jgi:hypothetical protein
LQTLCGECSERTVWSSGFADVAVIKPAVIRAVLKTGLDAVWMDTDVLVVDDVLPHLPPNVDIAIQAGAAPGSPEVYFREEVRTGRNHMGYECPLLCAICVLRAALTHTMQPARPQLCTGLYFIRSSPATVSLLEHSIHELAVHEADPKFGDQAAFNLALFEWAFRGQPGEPLTVAVLDPVKFPTGPIFFDHHDLFYGEESGNRAVAIHNNYIMGSGKKIERFKRHGMWMENRYADDDDVGGGGFWSVLRGEGGVCGAREGVGDENDYYATYDNLCAS